MIDRGETGFFSPGCFFFAAHNVSNLWPPLVGITVPRCIDLLRSVCFGPRFPTIKDIPTLRHNAASASPGLHAKPSISPS